MSTCHMHSHLKQTTLIKMLSKRKMRNSIIQEDVEFITNNDLEWKSLKNKVVLISGATGFLASYMVDVLLYLNETYDYNITIIALVRDTQKMRERFTYSLDKSYLIIKEYDLSYSGLEIDEDIDIIIHTASNATPKLFGQDPVGTILPNVVGTNTLLELANKKRVENFLYFSTSGVYGHMQEHNYPVKEDCFGYLDSMDVSSSYLESKRLGETLCSAYLHQYNIPIKVIRPAITYGPGIKENDGRSFADFMWSIVNKKNIELYSDGLVLRNFCYISDAVSGFFYILFNAKIGEAYNIASEEDISIRDLAYKLTKETFKERALDVEFKCDFSKNFMRKQFDRTTVDTSKARALGWKIEHSLDEGFQRAVASIEREI